MKALQVTQPGSFQTVQVPNLDINLNGPNYLIVKTSYAMMCGSDIPFFCGRKPNLPYPLRPGFPAHECVGEVIQSTSRDFEPGDWVVAMPEDSLGLAEYFLAPVEKAVLLSDSISGQAASCLIQPLSTVINGVDRLGDITGSTITIIGLGSIGLLFCWLLKKRGASRVVGIDPIPFRCKTAIEYGVDQTFTCTGSDFVENILGTQTTLPDICVEAAGHQMQTINDCIQIVKPNGSVLAFGVPDQDIYSIDYEVFFRKNATLLAVVTPKWDEYFQKAQDLLLDHRDELARLITHTFPVNNAEVAFKTYADHSGGIIKGIIDFSHWTNSNGFKKKEN